MPSPHNESLHHLEAFLNQQDLHLIDDQVPNHSWSNFLDRTGPLQKFEDGKGFYFSTRTDFPQVSLKYPPIPYGNFYAFEDLTDPDFGDFLTVGLASGIAIYLKIGSSLISLYTTYDYFVAENKWEYIGGTAQTNAMLSSIRRIIESAEDLKHLPKQEFIYFQKDFKREMHVFGTFKLGEDQHAKVFEREWFVDPDAPRTTEESLVAFNSLGRIDQYLGKNSNDSELIRRFFVDKLIELIPHEQAYADEFITYSEQVIESFSSEKEDPSVEVNKVGRILGDDIPDYPAVRDITDAKGRKPGFVNRLRNALADLLDNWANNLEHRARKNRDTN
jgi:hypothetical protein